MNGTKTQPTGGAGGASAMEARIERIRQSMATQQSRLARGSMLTASIGAILCVAMAIWFSIGYGMLRDMTTPKKIVEAAESVVLESLPDARKALEVQINDSADEWAASFSQQIQDNIPSVRSQLEDFIMTKADEALDEMHVMTADQFRKFVTQNNGMLSDGFMSLRKPDDAEKFVQDLHEAVQKEMSGDIRGQSVEMLHTVYDLNGKLEKLKIGQKLNSEQALEREILMIAKRLQLESQAELPDRPKKNRSKARFMEDATEGETPATAPAEDAEKAKEKEDSAKEAKEDKPPEKEQKSGDN